MRRERVAPAFALVLWLQQLSFGQIQTEFSAAVLAMLIMVGVLLDTMRQMETHLLMRHYDGFLKKGRLRGRF